jgi:hypothetical protein
VLGQDSFTGLRTSPPRRRGSSRSWKHLDSRLRGNECAWKQARSERCKSSLGSCPLPIVNSNCVAVRRGGEQLETKPQSVGRRTRFGHTLRRACSLEVKSRLEHGRKHEVCQRFARPRQGMGVAGRRPGSRSLSRWAGSRKAMAGRVGWLVTECREGRAM